MCWNKLVNYQILPDFDLSKFVSTAGASVHSTNNCGLNLQKFLEVYVDKWGKFLLEFLVECFIIQRFSNKRFSENCPRKLFHKVSPETYRCMKSARDQPRFRILPSLQLHSINSLTISKESINFSWKRFTFILFFGKMKTNKISIFSMRGDVVAFDGIFFC